MRYQNWILASALCCVPVIVAAAPPDLLAGTDTQSDASLYYLGLIFGNVGTVLQGTGTMVLGSVFKIYNAVILSLGLVTVLYTILMSTLHTAQEGEMMGKKFSSLWIPLKAGLGITMVTPLASGYCLFQMLTLWIILQGVGAANQLWGSVLDNAMQGNSIKPVEPSFEKKWNASPPDIWMMRYKITAQNVFNGLACKYAYQKAHETITAKNNAPADPADPIPKAITPLPLKGMAMEIKTYIAETMANETPTGTMRVAIGIEGNAEYATICGVQQNLQYNVAGIKSNTNTSGSAEKSGGIAGGAAAGAAVAGPIGAIGAVAIGGLADIMTRTYLPAQSYINTGVTKSRPDIDQAHAAALLAMAQNMDNAAKEAVYTKPTEYAPPPGFFKEAVKTYYNALQSKKFIDVSGPVPMDELLPELHTDTGDRLASARQGGWLYAGSYYFNLIYPPNSKKRIDAPAHNFDITELEKINMLTMTNKDYAISEPIKTGPISLPFSMPLANATDLYIKQSINPESSPVEKITPKENPRRSGKNVFIDAIRDSLMSNVMKTIDSITKSHGLDPMMSMSIWGTSLMVDTEIAFFAVLAVFIPLAAVGGVASSVNPVFAAIINAVMTIAPIILMIISTLWSAGALIAIYLPMIPYLLFFFSAIGWFLAVIEAIVAAPLIGLGLTSPSQEHLGKAAPAIMLITNVFLRPSLMVLGFIIGSRLFIIGVDMLHFSFDAAVRTQVADLTAFGAILIIVMYVSLALSIANKAFALIHVLPDRVLRWIGGQVEHWGQEAGQAVQQTQQEVKGAADATGKTMGEIGKAAISTAQEAGKAAGDTAKSAEGGGAAPGGEAAGGGASPPAGGAGGAGPTTGGATDGKGATASLGKAMGSSLGGGAGGGNDDNDSDDSSSSSSGGSSSKGGKGGGKGGGKSGGGSLKPQESKDDDDFKPDFDADYSGDEYK